MVKNSLLIFVIIICLSCAACPKKFKELDTKLYIISIERGGIYHPKTDHLIKFDDIEIENYGAISFIDIGKIAKLYDQCKEWK